MGHRQILAALALALAPLAPGATAQVAVRGGVIHTMAGPPIEDGVVLLRDGKIAEIGPRDAVQIPAGFEVLEAAVVTPGLVDARSVVGVAGYYNQEKGDQEQHEDSAAVQPELRALDAYNPREALVHWVRGFGVTTVQTGHAPRELVPGQLFIVKTRSTTADDAAIRPFSAVAATLSNAAKRSECAREARPAGQPRRGRRDRLRARQRPGSQRPRAHRRSGEGRREVDSALTPATTRKSPCASPPTSDRSTTSTRAGTTPSARQLDGADRGVRRDVRGRASAGGHPGRDPGPRPRARFVLHGPQEGPVKGL